MAFGIAWGDYFADKKYHIGLRAAYEFHEWWDQFNLRKFSSGPFGTPTTGGATATGIYDSDVVSRGNLSLNGFSLKLSLDI
jgi:hypothetical protein